MDVERLALKAHVNRLFTKSRSSAGSRTVKGLLSEEGVVVGRFKVRRLMSELGLRKTLKYCRGLVDHYTPNSRYLNI